MCEAGLSCQMLRSFPFGGWVPILGDSCEVSAQSPSEVTGIEPGKEVSYLAFSKVATLCL